MTLQELRRQHFRAAEQYFEAVIELQRMRDAGVARQDYQIFWRDTVAAAGAVVRSARLALQQGCLQQEDAHDLGFDILSRTALNINFKA